MKNMSLCLVSSIQLCFVFYEYPDKYANIFWPYNYFQDLKALFKETKQEVHKVQLGWENGMEFLGEIQSSVQHFSFLLFAYFCECV